MHHYTGQNSNFSNEAASQLFSLRGGLDIPLYKQLSELTIESIDRMQLMPGQKMPPTRELSRILQVSRKTVIRAYDELISRGYLTSEDGIGTFVSRSVCPPGDVISGRQMDIKLSAIAQRILQLPLDRMTCAHFPELNNGAPPAEMLPTRQWRRLMLELSRESKVEGSDFVKDSFGYAPLRQAICSYVLRKRGIRCSPDQVLIFTDATYSTYAAAQLLIEDGDCVAVEDPGYPYARMCFRMLNAEVLPVPVDHQGLRISELKKSPRKINALFVTPSHQDPSGGTLSMDSRMALLDWAAANNAVIFEDDFDSDFYYGASPQPALMSLDKCGSVLYFGNFFKLLYPLCAFGFLIVPPKLIDVFARAMVVGASASPSRLSRHEELTMTAMLNDGILEKHIRAVQVIYNNRRIHLIGALTKHLRHVVKIATASGGMTQLVEVDRRFNEDFVLQCARQTGLPMASIAPYYCSGRKANQFIISFACLDRAETDLVVSRFARALLAGS